VAGINAKPSGDLTDALGSSRFIQGRSDRFFQIGGACSASLIAEFEHRIQLGPACYHLRPRFDFGRFRTVSTRARG
jgi:hypothetical protein